MRHLQYFILATLVGFVLIMQFTQCSTKAGLREQTDQSGLKDAWNVSIRDNANDMIDKGRAVFRFETFGSEVFWSNELRLHQVIADSKHGGIGDGLTPEEALAAGLKVDSFATSVSDCSPRSCS